MSSLPDGGRHGEAQALPLPRLVRSQTGDSRGLQKVGAKKHELQRRSESGKEVLLCILSVKSHSLEQGRLQYEKVGSLRSTRAGACQSSCASSEKNVDPSRSMWTTRE